MTCYILDTSNHTGVIVAVTVAVTVGGKLDSMCKLARCNSRRRLVPLSIHRNVCIPCFSPSCVLISSAVKDYRQRLNLVDR